MSDESAEKFSQEMQGLPTGSVNFKEEDDANVNESFMYVRGKGMLVERDQSVPISIFDFLSGDTDTKLAKCVNFSTGSFWIKCDSALEILLSSSHSQNLKFYDSVEMY